MTLKGFLLGHSPSKKAYAFLKFLRKPSFSVLFFRSAALFLTDRASRFPINRGRRIEVIFFRAAVQLRKDLLSDLLPLSAFVNGHRRQRGRQRLGDLDIIAAHHGNIPGNADPVVGQFPHTAHGRQVVGAQHRRHIRKLFQHFPGQPASGLVAVRIERVVVEDFGPLEVQFFYRFKPLFAPAVRTESVLVKGADVGYFPMPPCPDLLQDVRHGLAVIVDEQHRFGVSQREALRAKGNNPDLLALSATPIPRTLSMTIYGDMDVSVINEKPAGRLPIKTTKLPISRTNELIERLKIQINGGAKVFWVCPLVEDSDASDLTAVQSRYDELRKVFPHAGLVHGQMDKKQRDAVMREFADDKSDMKILVATTVIEVGIDVPRATIIVIENAERFGLAALHQLRGRVGRGSLQSYCILVYGNNISDEGLKRLDVLTQTDDGFVIAEQDLIMRGTGELLGTRQSGWINYHFVDYSYHRDLFKLAAGAARDMVSIDDWTRDLMFIFDRGVGISA